MTLTQVIHLGGTAKDEKVYKIGHGLMRMTGTPVPLPDEQCFEAIKAGIDSLPEGTKMFINSSEFYGLRDPTDNLQLIARFLDKYPLYGDKMFLSVKGATHLKTRKFDCSEEFIRSSVGNINAKLRGTKVLDMFEPARMDGKTSVEDVMRTLVALVKEGKFKHISLSEIAASTLRRAAAVYPVSAVEIEVSAWSYETETKAVIQAAKELGVTVVAYSPLGRGFLTGTLSKPSDLEPGDLRLMLDRFKEDAMLKNTGIRDALDKVGKAAGLTLPQLSIAWVGSLGDHMLPLPGSSKAERTLQNLQAGEIELSEETKAAVQKIIETHEVEGGRYIDAAGPDAFRLWG